MGLRWDPGFASAGCGVAHMCAKTVPAGWPRATVACVITRVGAVKGHIGTSAALECSAIQKVEPHVNLLEGR